MEQPENNFNNPIPSFSDSMDRQNIGISNPDVTERAQLIAKLRETEELNRQSQALSHTGNWKWIINNDEIEWSDEMYRIYDLVPQSEKITFNRFLTFIHDDDRSRRISEIRDAIKTGKASDFVMKIVTRNGVMKILKGKSAVLFDKNKQVIGMHGTSQDITQEYTLNAELHKKNEELTQKNKDLESFNFIANHDLQEPLRKIQVYSNRILYEGTKDIPDKLLTYFRKISQASERMQKNLEDLLVFYQYRHTEDECGQIDLQSLIAEIRVEFLENITQTNAELIVHDLPPVYGFKIKIKQMLKHLLSNALKFKKQDQPPKIIITPSIKKTAAGKTYIGISVKDNGIGFDQKYSERIFELFQRLHTKDEYTGSGIGLALCKKIAEDHGGWIEVVSEPGQGSVFSVFLPTKE